MTGQPTLLLCVPDGVDPSPLAEGLRSHLSEVPLVIAPDGEVAATLERLAGDGAETVILMAAELFAGPMLKDSLPSAVERVTASYPDIEIRLAREIGIDPKVLRAATSCVAPAITRKVEETVLIVIGDGGMPTDGRADLAKLARMVWEGVGFAWTEVCYLDGASPGLSESFAKAKRLGYADHIAFVCSLRTAELPIDPTDVVIAPALAGHPLVVETLAERYTEAVTGADRPAMNCQVCTFREQVLGDSGHHHHHHHDHDHHHGTDATGSDNA